MQWSTNPEDLRTPTPYAVGRDRSEASATKKVLAESSPEQIAEQFLSDPAVRANVSHAQDCARPDSEEYLRGLLDTYDEAYGHRLGTGTT